MRNHLPMIFVLAALCAEELHRLKTRLERAIRLCALTEQQACCEMDIRPQHWDDMKNGRRPLSLQRFALRLPEAWKWFQLLGLQEDGMPQLVERAAPVIARLQQDDVRRSA